VNPKPHDPNPECSEGVDRKMNKTFRLDSQSLKGIWAGPPTFWDEDFRLDEETHFFQELHHSCPDVPIIHYNIPRAKRFLIGEDYQRNP